MAAEKPIQANLSEYSRCDDRSWLPVEEKDVDHKADQIDASIAEKVDRALWNNDMLRSTDYDEIDVDVKDGIVFLSRHVISNSNQQQAKDTVRTIPEVMGIKSYLVPDDKIMCEVAGALGKIEHIYGVKFFTGVQHGVVGLQGTVISGVRGVINSIQVPGVDLEAEDQRFLQHAIGKQIYFRDGRSGVVQKVIINPNNRRVTAMDVLGRVSNPKQDPRFLTYGEDQLPEKLIVIPMSAIRYLTKSCGFLNIESVEATRYSDFDIYSLVQPALQSVIPD